MYTADEKQFLNAYLAGEHSLLAKKEFLDVDLNDEDVDLITEKTSLDLVKKTRDEDRRDGDIKLCRKGLDLVGLVGDWKNYLTVARSDLIDKKVKEILIDTNLSFTYELGQH
ncbi:unnamed protein product [Clavelina lepadiformis]|uniref:Sulfotransferase n=1 Tax=Clavelina lepadiformis TaxID=159417 RepID=A0ABP0GPF4_CLALP